MKQKVKNINIEVGFPKILVVLMMLATFSLGDVVITTKEVVHGTVIDADTLYVRMRLLSGGIKVFSTKEVYEIRFSDFDRVASFANKLPGVRVVPDTGKIFMRPEAGIKQVSAYDPVASGNFIFGGGGSYTATKIGGMLTSAINITPNIGYFVTRGVATGGEIIFTSTSIGEMANSKTIAFGPKVWFVLGSRGSSGFFLGELGIAYLSFGKEITGTRTSFGIGYLPLIENYIGVPIKVSLFVDNAGGNSMTNWLLSIGICGMIGPTKLEE